MPSCSFLPSCTGDITCHFSVGLGRGEQGGTPCKLVILRGGPMLKKNWVQRTSWALSFQKTCDFEGGTNANDNDNDRVQEVLWTLFFLSIGPPLKITSLQGVPSCSPLPSPTLKWQVISPVQLGRKEQEGTPCKLVILSGGGPMPKKLESQELLILCHFKKLVILRGGTNAEKNRVEELLWLCHFKKLVILRGGPVKKTAL